MDCNYVFDSEVRLITEFPQVNCLNILMTVFTEVNPVRFVAFRVKIVEVLMVPGFAEGAFEALRRPFESAQ